MALIAAGEWAANVTASLIRWQQVHARTFNHRSKLGLEAHLENDTGGL